MSWKEILGLLLDVIRKILDRINDYWTGKKYSDAQDNINNKDSTVDNVINSILQNTCTCSKQFSEADTTCRVHQRSFICAKLDKRSVENYQPVRIQIGDGKEAMIYPIIPDWHTVSISTPITGKSRCYIRIPSFSFNDIDTTRDSYVRLQYNYSADKDFTIGKIPKVIGSGVVLCIRYRVGDNIFRWKLWEDELFTQNIPLYNGEVIKKNFVIEVWTLKGKKEIGIGSDLLLNTTIRRDSVSINDYKYENNSISNITIYDDIRNYNHLLDEVLSGNLMHNWNPDNAEVFNGLVTKIKDDKDSNDLYISSIRDAQCTLIKGDSLFNGCSYIKTSGNGIIRSTIPVTSNFSQYYDTIGFVATAGASFLVSFHNCVIEYMAFPNEKTLQFSWRGTNEKRTVNDIDYLKPFIIFAGITGYGDGERMAEAVVWQGNSFQYVNGGLVDFSAPVPTEENNGLTSKLYIPFSSDPTAGISNLGGVVAYKCRTGRAALTGIYASFKTVYLNEILLPLKFNEGIAWLDNEN